MKYFEGRYNTQIFLGITENEFLKIARKLNFNIDFILARNDFDTFFENLEEDTNFDFVCYNDFDMHELYYEDLQNTVVFVIEKFNRIVKCNYTITTQFLSEEDKKKVLELLD